ncbi:MAG: hypothetical protein ACRD2C_22435 [Acidimicrobiales bacterium]
MVSEGTVRAPAEQGMADLIPDLAEGVSLSDLVIADRDKERNR